MRHLFLIIILIVAARVVAQAQYEKAPPCALNNPHLIGELKKGVIENISLWSNASSYGLMATSTLAPSGKNPHDSDHVLTKENKTEEEENEAAIAEIESYNASEDWICQYSAHNISDGETTTAWVEGSEGDGVGEAVISGELDIKKPVKIWVGYGKSETLFKANNRPARVRVYLLATNCPHPSQFASNYSALTVIGVSEITLKDLNAYQNLPLPVTTKPWKPQPCEYEEEHAGTYFVALEILSVYKGSRYHDTCISEIGN